MTKLSDIGTILLSAAAVRDSGSLLPAPATLTATPARIRKAITALLKGGFAEERETNDHNSSFRTDGDLAFAAAITAAGYAAIGVEPPVAADTAPSAADASMLPADATPRPTKTSMVIGMMRREQGATLPELIAATGWLPHSTRGALTGIRKKGAVRLSRARLFTMQVDL